MTNNHFHATALKLMSHKSKVIKHTPLGHSFPHNRVFFWLICISWHSHYFRKWKYDICRKEMEPDKISCHLTCKIVTNNYSKWNFSKCHLNTHIPKLQIQYIQRTRYTATTTDSSFRQKAFMLSSAFKYHSLKYKQSKETH